MATQANTPDITPDDVRAVLTALENCAVGYAEEYGILVQSPEQVVAWAFGADVSEASEAEREPFAAYLRLKAVVQP